MSTAPVGGRTLEALKCVQAACRRPRSGAGSSLFRQSQKYRRHAKDCFAKDWVAEARNPVHTAIASGKQNAGQKRAALPPTGWDRAARVRDCETHAFEARLIR